MSSESWRAQPLIVTTDAYASLQASIQEIELGRDGENLEKLSMETTVLNVHYVIHITGFHVILMRPD